MCMFSFSVPTVLCETGIPSGGRASTPTAAAACRMGYTMPTALLDGDVYHTVEVI
jgi:hypothetical protein